MSFRRNPNVDLLYEASLPSKRSTIKYKSISECVTDNLMNHDIRHTVNGLATLTKDDVFVDTEFGHQKDAILGRPEEPGVPNFWGRYRFLRSREIFYGQRIELFGNLEPSAPTQGSIGNGYFISALRILAGRPELIKRLFDVTKYNPQGFYTIWINVNGVWEQIVIDDFLPADINERGEIEHPFSQAGGPYIWTMLLEKAYAKAYGSYARMDSGNIYSAMRDLTGAPCIRFTDVDLADNQELENLWHYLKEADEKNYIVFANVPTYKGEGVSLPNSGLQTGYSYEITGVLEKSGNNNTVMKLVKIRLGTDNVGQWRGSMPAYNNPSEPGVVIMTLNEVQMFFDSVGVCMLRAEAEFNAIRLPVADISAVRFTIHRRGEYTFSVDQKDPKSFPAEDEFSREIVHSYVRLTIAQIHANGDTVFKGHKIQLAQNVFIQNIFDEGDYIAIIEPYFVGQGEELVFSSYGPEIINLELHTFNVLGLKMMEYAIWQSFAKMEESQSEFQEVGQLEVATSPYTKIYRVKNDGIITQAFTVAIYSPPQVFDTITTINQGGLVLVANANDVGILLEKKNPLFKSKASIPLLKRLASTNAERSAAAQVQLSYEHNPVQEPLPQEKLTQFRRQLERFGLLDKRSEMTSTNRVITREAELGLLEKGAGDLRLKPTDNPFVGHHDKVPDVL